MQCRLQVVSAEQEVGRAVAQRKRRAADCGALCSQRRTALPLRSQRGGGFKHACGRPTVNKHTAATLQAEGAAHSPRPITPTRSSPLSMLRKASMPLSHRPSCCAARYASHLRCSQTGGIKMGGGLIGAKGQAVM
jgi:hypothetical protein